MTELEKLNLFKKIVGTCLQCEKPLEEKLIKRAQNRCKKCQREYAYEWFEDRDTFLKVFQGQY